MKLAGSLPFALLAAVASGCGDSGGSGGGTAPSCQLTADTATAEPGATVQFKLTANFAPESVTLDGQRVFDRALDLDAGSTSEAVAGAPFERTFSRTVSRSGSYEAAVRLGASEAKCSTNVALQGGDDDALGHGPSSGRYLTLALQSSAKGTGKRQAVFRCPFTNDNQTPASSATRILDQGGGRQGCELGVSQADLSLDTPPENVVPHPYGSEQTADVEMPASWLLQIDRVDGDTSDRHFKFGSFGTWDWKGFANYDDCQVAKAAVLYRLPDFSLASAEIVWDRVTDPISGARLWKMRRDPATPTGTAIRAALQVRPTMYYYCDWQHTAKPLFVGSTIGLDATELKESFGATAKLRFDLLVVSGGSTLVRLEGASKEQLEQALAYRRVAVDASVTTVVSIRDASGALLATNDATLAAGDERLKAVWDRDCADVSTKATAKVARPDDANALARADVKLCDFNSLMLAPLKVVTTKRETIDRRQVVLKCDVVDDSFTNQYHIDKARCGWGRPAIDANAENFIPAPYAAGGPLSESLPILKWPLLGFDQSTGPQFKWDDLEMPFSSKWACLRTVYQFQYIRAGAEKTAFVSYHRAFNAAASGNSVIGKFKWVRDEGQEVPTNAEIKAKSDGRFSVYIYCSWYPKVLGAEAVPAP